MDGNDDIHERASSINHWLRFHGLGNEDQMRTAYEMAARGLTNEEAIEEFKASGKYMPPADEEYFRDHPSYKKGKRYRRMLKKIDEESVQKLDSGEAYFDLELNRPDLLFRDGRKGEW